MDETISTSASTSLSLGMVSVCCCGDLSSSGSTRGFARPQAAVLNILQDRSSQSIRSRGTYMGDTGQRRLPSGQGPAKLEMTPGNDPWK